VPLRSNGLKEFCGRGDVIIATAMPIDNGIDAVINAPLYDALSLAIETEPLDM